MNQLELFDLPRNPACVCQVCGADLRTDNRGVQRHKTGEGKRCDEILLSRRTTSAHPTTETGATLKLKP